MDFQKLEVYKKSKEFHINCKRILASAKPEKFVVDQLGRASFSIVLNIAEGSGKSSSNDRKNFFTISRASVYECVAVLDILKDEGRISDDDFMVNMDLAEQLSKMLYSITSQKQKHKRKEKQFTTDCDSATVSVSKKTKNIMDF